MMKFLVKQQKIEVLEREIIASDQIAFVSVKFVFDVEGYRRIFLLELSVVQRQRGFHVCQQT